MARLRLITDQIRELEAARVVRIEQAPDQGANPMVLLLARVVGVGIETADMLVHEILSRGLRDRRAVARYAGLTGSPDESGATAAWPRSRPLRTRMPGVPPVSGRAWWPSARAW